MSFFGPHQWWAVLDISEGHWEGLWASRLLAISNPRKRSISRVTAVWQLKNKTWEQFIVLLRTAVPLEPCGLSQKA